MRVRKPLPPSRQLFLFAGLVLALEAVTVMASPSAAVMPFVLVLIPAAAAILVSAVSGGRAAVGSLLGRAVRAKVQGRWYVIAVGIPVAEKVLVDLTGMVLGLTTPDRLLQALTVSAFVVPFVVLVPALLEELGWRGFGVQSAMDQGHSPIWAVATIGTLFLTLHVPLYLPGQSHDGLAWWPLPLHLFAASVVLTWVYLRTGSVLVAGLMHAAFNATVPLTWGLDADWVWATRGLVMAVLAAAVIARVGLTWWTTPQTPADPTSPTRRMPGSASPTPAPERSTSP